MQLVYGRRAPVAPIRVKTEMIYVSVSYVIASAWTEIPDIIVINPEVPIEDTTVGNWTNEGGLSTGIYQSIDEVLTSINDDDYAQSPDPGNNDIYKVKLSSPSDPDPLGPHSVYYRYRKSGAGTANLKVRLLQGAATLVEWTHADISTGWTTTEQTLTQGQVNTISDYTDLYLELEGY